MTVYCGSTLKKEKKIITSLSLFSLFSSIFFFFFYRSHFILIFLPSLAFLSLSFFTPRGKPQDCKVGSEQNQKKGSEIERMAGARGCWERMTKAWGCGFMEAALWVCGFASNKKRRDSYKEKKREWHCDRERKREINKKMNSF